MAAGAGWPRLYLIVIWIMLCGGIGGFASRAEGFSAAAGAVQQPPWQVTLVPGGSQAGQPSFELDLAGMPHLLFYEPVQQALLYAARQPGGWVLETALGSLPALEAPPGLAVDQQGIVHAAYLTPSRSLMYIQRTCTSGACTWSSPVQAASGLLPGASAPLALDSIGRPHLLAYRQEGTTSLLEDVYTDGVAWYRRTVDATPGAGAEAVLVLDGALRLNAAYLGPEGGLEYAWFNGAGWQHTAVEEEVSAYPNLVWDSGLYLAYYRPGDHWLRVKVLASGWQDLAPAPEDPLPDGLTGLSLQIKDGQAYLAYAEPSGSLHFGYSQPGQTWTSSLVPGGGSQPVLHFDPAGFPNLAYIDASGRLALAVQAYPYYLPLVLNGAGNP